MAVSTIIGGFQEGSLLKRTLFHVTAFVLGSMAFIGLVSFICVSVARGLLPSPSHGDDTGISAPTKADVAGKPALPGIERPRPGVMSLPRTPGKDG